MKRTLLTLTVAALILTSMSLFVMAAEGKGCGAANCHVVGSKYDLTAEVKNIKGHPPVKPGALYEDCLKCHKSGKLAFGPILHKAHYHEGENHFIEKYEGRCQNCHTVDPNTGKIGLEYAK
ncbi:MAG: hypothetical protein H0Z38_02555 [Firmicutes bacterium]|nr:hypothetical protein [Bacillota bacterium]